MTTQQKISLPKLYHRAQFAPNSLDPIERTVNVVWSTGARVRRYRLFEEAFDEELSLLPEHVRLARLNQGAPLLNSHQGHTISDVIGVVERAWVENDQGFAVVRFSARPDVAAIVQDVQENILRNISVGYCVHRYEEVEPEQNESNERNEKNETNSIRILRATDWEPFELSLVAVNADSHAQIRDQTIISLPCEIITRSMHSLPFLSSEDTFLQTNTTHLSNQENERNEKSELIPDQKTDSESSTRAAESLMTHSDSASAQAILQERERSSAILEAVRSVHLKSSLAKRWIEEGVSLEEARKRILEKLTKKQEIQPTRNYLRIESGKLDETETRRQAIASALLHRFDPSRYELKEPARRYWGLSLMELARETVERHGVRTQGLHKLEIAQRAMHTTSDFPLILANVANKTLRDAYEAAPQTFRPFVRETTAPDFKLMTRVQLGDAPQLQKVNEHGEFAYGTIGEAQEQYQVASYGKIISFSRQLLINDDLNALTRIPQLFGRAAANLESDLVYGIFRDNPKMGDGKTLFSTSHANIEDKGSLISVESISKGRTALRLQTGLNGDRMNLTPRYLLVPAVMETLADQFISQNFLPNVQSNINPFAGRLQVISEPRLDDSSLTAWYLMADPRQIDLVEIAYLEGHRGVHLETRMGFEIDGMEIKARIDVGVKAIDWRGFYKNVGEKVSTT